MSEIATTLRMELPQFIGTEHYYTCAPFCAVKTDGVKFLADTGYCHWLVDSVLIHTLSLARKHPDRGCTFLP